MTIPNDNKETLLGDSEEFKNLLEPSVDEGDCVVPVVVTDQGLSSSSTTTTTRTPPPITTKTTVDNSASVRMSTTMVGSSNEELSQHDAFMQLIAPDGYYKYLGVERIPVTTDNNNTATDSPPPNNTSNTNNTSAFAVDPDAVKKAYRRLSRRHHPDKGGDPNTFRVLNRAQRVLLHPKLRAQYDNLGIDLDEDELDNNHHNNNNDSSSSANGGNDNGGSNGGANKDEGGGNGLLQGIVSELAQVALAGMMHLTTRTALMGVVAVVVVRYWFTAYPAMLFLAYVVMLKVGKAYMIRGGSVYDTGSGTHLMDAIAPSITLLGVLFMFLGRRSSSSSDTTTTSSSNGQDGKYQSGGGDNWTLFFWLGETMVLASFTYNSLPSIPWNIQLLSGLTVASGVVVLWLRGNFYHYLTAVILELILTFLVAMAFPIIELLLDTILTEKLKKVGEKIRSHHQQLEQYYHANLQQQQDQQRQDQPQQRRQRGHKD